MAAHDVLAAIETVADIAFAVKDPEHWSQIARSAARALDAGRATVGFLDARGRMLVRACPETDPGWHARYDAEMHAANHLWTEAARVGAGEALTETNADARASYRRSIIFNEFVRPQGFDSLMTLTLSDPRSGMVGLLTLGRRAGQEPFGLADIRLGRQLASAISRSLCALGPVFTDVGNAPEGDHETLVTPEGRVLKDAAWMADWVRAGIIEIRRGYLSMPLLPGLAAAIRATGRAADSWPPPVGMVIGPVETVFGPIRVALRRGGRSAPGAVRLRITRLPQSDPPTRLAAEFALTPRETQIACLLAQGCALPDAAERLAISLTTARTHLSRLFDKTGTRTQLQLGLLVQRRLETET